MSFFSAVLTSTTTSPAPGQRPATRVTELLKRRCAGSMLNPRVGAPPNTIGLPFLSISVASPPTLPIASATPGIERTLRSNDSANGKGSHVTQREEGFPVMTTTRLGG